MAITLTLNNNEFTVNQVDLNAIINLTATASDSSEPGRLPDNFVYSWTVVDKPPTSTFALDQNVGRNVQGIMDVWGTVRVFCIATNPDSGETSETDPLIAPNEAFCDIKVTHSSTLLQKPAKSQRNWHDEYWSLVDYVANIRGNNIDVDFAFGRNDADPTTRTSGVVQLASVVDTSKGRDYDTNTYTAQQMANGEGPYYSIIPSGLVGAILDGGALGVPPHDVGGENVLAAAIEIRSVIGVSRQNLSLLNDVDYSRAQREGDRLRWDDTAENWIPYESYRFNEGIVLNSANEGFDETDNTGEVGPILWTKDDNTYARLHYDIDDNYLEVGDIASFAPDTQKSIDLGTATQRWNTLFVSAFSIDMENGVISMDTGGKLQVSDGGITKAAALIDNTSLITNGVVKWDGTNFITELLSAGEGDITEVIAGSGLSGGGAAGSVTLVASDINTTHIDSTALITSADSFADSDTSIMTAAAIADYVAANAVGSSSVGDVRDIQLADGSGGFIAANWQVSTGDDLIPTTTNAYDVGSSTNRVRKVYAYDGQFYDDVRVEGDLTVVGQQIMQDYAFINDDGAAGSLLFTAGENGVVAGSIRNKTDNVIIESVASGGEASLEFKAGVGATATQKILSNSPKLSNSNSIKLPAMASAPSVGDFLKTTVVSGRDVEVEFESVVERIVYSTHVSREVSEEASFTAGNMVFTGNQQACMYWIQNNTGSSIELKATHIHVGEMKNLSLSFSLCKATSAANAISNTWTQVGSEFTITNSSGTDNVIGQAQASVFTTTTLAAGEYLGLVCTDIPVLNRDDRRIVISFDCEKVI